LPVARIRKYGPAVFCAAYLAVQIVLALRGLTQPGRFRFSWGMYAVAQPVPTIDVEYRDHTDQDVGNKFIALEGRPEIDYERLLPPYICATAPAATAIHVESHVYPCRR
jgi:hypothetical protein